jgi:hypothetical protein
MSELQSLTEMQAKFVLMITSDPTCIGKPKEAAIAAGYSPETAHIQCYQLLSKHHVQDAIRQANAEQISGPLASKAVAFIRRILDDEEAPKGVRLDAAKTVLDRAGHVAARTPTLPGDLSKKPLSEMTAGELAKLTNQAAERRKELELQLRDVTSVPEQIDGSAVELTGDDRLDRESGGD